MIPYLLEINKGPDMKAKDINDTNLKSKVQRYVEKIWIFKDLQTTIYVATMKKNKGMKFKQVLKMAKKTYKKSSSGASPKKSRRRKRKSRRKRSKSRGKKKRKTKRRRRRRRKR